MNATETVPRTVSYLDRFAASLDAAAVAGAASDARNHVDVGFGLPTPGQGPICSIYCRARAQLPAVQDADAAELSTRIAELKHREQLLASHDVRRPLPPGTPGGASKAVGLWLAAGCTALVAETVLLAEPINEALQGGTGFPLEGATAAAFIASLLGGLAHVRAHTLDELTAGDIEPRRRRSLERVATAATFGVAAGGGAAVLSRIYDASIGGGLDAAGVAFFVLLQVLLILAALALPTLMMNSVRADRRARAESARRATLVELGEAEQRLDRFSAERPRHLDELTSITIGALGKHIQHLADALEDEVLSDRWRNRHATAHRDGTLHTLVLALAHPTAPPRPQPVEQQGVEKPPAPTTVDERAAADAAETPVGDAAGAGEPRCADADVRRHELLDDIFNRRDT